MKRNLIIGSSVVDVIIRVHQMPQTAGDENIISQHFSMGGCAFNVAMMLDYLHVPYTLFSPVGTGLYGDYVKKFMNENEIPIYIETNENNGCCYCLVDDDGERTFICEHGAEYLYQKEWFEKIDAHDYQQVYVCGLEIEEKTGDIIIDFLEKNPHLQIFFAPGPRICSIDPKKLKRLFQLHPIVHLNYQELMAYTQSPSLDDALKAMYALTSQTVVVTLGQKGSIAHQGEDIDFHSSYPVEVVNTIGAGDAHMGSVMAMQAMDQSWHETLKTASKMSAQVIQQEIGYLPIKRP